MRQYNMQFFFGPNSYKVLKEYGDHLDLPDVINMGWKWIAWFNKYFVIPVFQFPGKPHRIELRNYYFIADPDHQNHPVPADL